MLRATKHCAAVGALHGGDRGGTRKGLRYYYLPVRNSVFCHGRGRVCLLIKPLIREETMAITRIKRGMFCSRGPQSRKDEPSAHWIGYWDFLGSKDGVLRGTDEMRGYSASADL